VPPGLGIIRKICLNACLPPHQMNSLLESFRLQRPGGKVVSLAVTLAGGRIQPRARQQGSAPIGRLSGRFEFTAEEQEWRRPSERLSLFSDNLTSCPIKWVFMELSTGEDEPVSTTKV
jgi:hypothetical protein